MQDTTETSVFVSLRELVSLEDERLREEEEERALRQRRAEEAGQRREAELVAAERARREAEAEARAEQRRQAAEEAARLRAIERATIERARLEVEASAARELLEVQNHHERELVRAREARSSGKVRVGLGIVVLVLVGGAAGALGVQRHLASERAAHDARIAMLDGERQRLFAEGLASLDRLHRQLEDRLEKRASVEGPLAATRARTRAIRAGLSPEAVDEEGLDAFEAALDELRSELSRQHGRDRLARLDALHGELRAAFERVRRPGDGLAKASAKAQTTRRGLDASEPREEALRAFEQALEAMTVEITQAAASAPVNRPVTSVATPPVVEENCDWNDPMSFCLDRK